MFGASTDSEVPAAARVVAVVVTHNRRALLEQCLAALRAQTHAPATIVVIDNCSTDGTAQLLAGAAGDPGTPVRSVRPTENLGGAGGFALGIETAMALGPAWLWLMDDDSVPDRDALEQLLEAHRRLDAWSGQAPRGGQGGRAKAGFLASRVVWTDGRAHVMNTPGRMSRRRPPPAPPGMEAVDYASFVSLLVSAAAVLECGLPLAEFFIGSDDVEYTWRITRAEFRGYYVPASRVAHLTAGNTGMDLWNPPVSAGDLEKWACKTRNLVAVNRRRPWGWLREGVRVAVLPAVWRLRGMGAGERRRLAQAAREGLTWAYEPLIRFPRQ